MSSGLDLSELVRRSPDGTSSLDLAVDGITCASCLPDIEKGVGCVPGVESARLNLTARRLTTTWRDQAFDPAEVVRRLSALGFRGRPYLRSDVEDEEAREQKRLTRCLAVAAFATMNVMLLSVSVWSGNVSDITTETRDLFHWVSALIALPAAAYAGRPFYARAWSALKAGRLNMDVPISLGVILALGLSLYETSQSAHHAYFDSALMLLTFLLAGRALDHAMRRRTRAVASNLLALRADIGNRIEPGGGIVEVPAQVLRPGDRILVRPGERFPVDGLLLTGEGRVDAAAITGETALADVRPGDRVFAGTLNHEAVLTVEVRAPAEGSLIEDVHRLLETALEARGGYRRLADRVARAYAPVVHLAAGLTLAAWLWAGAGLHQSIVVAVAVLIITCPCALALAVPAVQVVASGALFRAGVILNAGDSIERIAACDTVVFDKTGTLTAPEPAVVNADEIDPALIAIAAGLAQASRHPLASAIASAVADARLPQGASEVPGQGVMGVVDGIEVRLGRPEFCGIAPCDRSGDRSGSTIAVRFGEQAAILAVRQVLRPDARATVDGLRAMGLRLAILSGDRPEAVEPVAGQLSIGEWTGGLKPDGKIAALEAMKARGHKVLMIGDGLNDAAALAAAHASLSPSNAVHLTQTVADAIVLGDRLAPAVEAVALARKARAMMVQNLAISLIYNAFAVPIAMLGYVTPLIAALAMSGSSIIVTLNAFRAGGTHRFRGRTADPLSLGSVRLAPPTREEPA